MNITTGPILKRYSDVFDITEAEVLDWVNKYVNEPEKHFPAYEPTEKERLESIKRYIDWRLSNTSWAKVAMRKERKAA